jgi:hypothetical protein
MASSGYILMNLSGTFHSLLEQEIFGKGFFRLSAGLLIPGYENLSFKKP